jgi:hypothetical protein
LFQVLIFYSAHGQDFKNDDWIFSDQSLPEIYIQIASDSLDQLLQEQNWYSDHEYPATFIFLREGVADTVQQIGFRIRGNTSRASAKKSFKVSFNTFQAGRQYNGLDKLNLNGEHNDPSIIRSKLSWDIFGKLGFTAPRANHVKLFINGEYYGLYINVEHIDDEFIQKNFLSDEGNLYKCLYPADLTYRGRQVEAYKFEDNGRRIYDLKTNEEADDYNDLANFIIFLNTSSDSQFENEIEDYINVDGVLRWMAVDILTANWDNYWFLKNNFYLYYDPATQRFEFIPYDYDNTFGIWWEGILPGTDWGRRDFIEWGHPYEERPLTTRLLSVEKYQKRLHYYIDQTIKTAFNETWLFSEIDRLKALTEEAAEEDLYRTYDYGFSIEEYHDSFDSALGRHVTYGIKPYISTRVESAMGMLQVENIHPVVREVNHEVVSSESERKLQLDLHLIDESDLEFTIYVNDEEVTNQVSLSTLDRIDPHDRRYRLEFIVPESIEELSYFFNVTDAEGLTSRYPHNPQKTVQLNLKTSKSPILINEFLADNETGIQDESGKFEDWIELYNSSDSLISVSGYFLTDDLSTPSKWALPDTTIEPKSYLLIWADNDDEEGPLHTNFGLSNNGEEIGLFYSDDFILVDSVRFGPQSDDISYGRREDGGPDFVFFETPTPGAQNQSATSLHTDSELPTEFFLSQNYPNPFNPSTSIHYSIPKKTHVTLTIFSITGQRVAELVNKTQAAGHYEVSFDASNLSTGTYLYRLSTQEDSKTRLMTFLK